MAQSWDTAGRKAIVGCIQIGTHTQTEKEKNRIGLHLGTTSASLPPILRNIALYSDFLLDRHTHYGSMIV